MRKGCVAPALAAAYVHDPDNRPSVEAAAKAWYAQAKAAFLRAHPGGWTRTTACRWWSSRLPAEASEPRIGLRPSSNGSRKTLARMAFAPISSRSVASRAAASARPCSIRVWRTATRVDAARLAPRRRSSSPRISLPLRWQAGFSRICLQVFCPILGKTTVAQRSNRDSSMRAAAGSRDPS